MRNARKLARTRSKLRPKIRAEARTHSSLGFQYSYPLGILMLDPSLNQTHAWFMLQKWTLNTWFKIYPQFQLSFVSRLVILWSNINNDFKFRLWSYANLRPLKRNEASIRRKNLWAIKHLKELAEKVFAFRLGRFFCHHNLFSAYWWLQKLVELVFHDWLQQI